MFTVLLKNINYFFILSNNVSMERNIFFVGILDFGKGTEKWSVGYKGGHFDSRENKMRKVNN